MSPHVGVRLCGLTRSLTLSLSHGAAGELVVKQQQETQRAKREVEAFLEKKRLEEDRRVEAAAAAGDAAAVHGGGGSSTSIAPPTGLPVAWGLHAVFHKCRCVCMLFFTIVDVCAWSVSQLSMGVRLGQCAVTEWSWVTMFWFSLKKG